MKKILGLLVMFLLMGMLCGVAMASTDSGPLGATVLMFSMGDALGDVAGTPAAAIVARTNKFDEPSAPAILVGCNRKIGNPGTGHLGGVSLAGGNPMATTTYIDMELALPDRAFNPLI